jgi:hypothetical protein
MATAKTHIVGDYGHTIDIGEYYTQSKVEEKKPYSKDDLKSDVNAQFPLKSTLRLGKLYKKKTSVYLPASVALVGTDKYSKAWLQKNIDEIKRVGGIVIIIDCPSLTKYTRFESALVNAGLFVSRSSSRPFEEIVDAYPVLITNGNLIQ